MTGSEDAKELDAPEQGTDTDPNAAAVEVWKRSWKGRKLCGDYTVTFVSLVKIN
jgi:hypothetical protein